MATRLTTICTTASPVDTQRDAEKVATTLREKGEFVRLSAIFYMPEGTRKAGMPAIQLEVSDQPFPDLPKTATAVQAKTEAVAVASQSETTAAPAPQVSADRPLTFAEMDARDREQAARDAEGAVFKTPREAGEVIEPAPVKKRGGRPKGSKNRKTKAAA